MKRTAIIAAALSASLMFPLAGCGTNAPNTEQSTGDGTKTEETAQSVDDKWPDNYVTALVPKPTFSVPIKSISEDDSSVKKSLTAEWEGVTREEADAYLQSLKDAGFTVGALEQSGRGTITYSARNAEIKAGTSYGKVLLSFVAIADGSNTLSLQVDLYSI